MQQELPGLGIMHNFQDSQAFYKRWGFAMVFMKKINTIL